MAAKKRSGRQASISKVTTMTPPQALQTLYLEYLKPVIDTLPAGAAMKAALGSDEVLLLFHDNLSSLSHVFSMYAGCSHVDNENPPYGLMDVKMFCSFVTDGEFLGRNADLEEENDLTLKDARQIFSASQHDLDVNEEEMKLVQQKGSESHQEQMVFAEFLEACARLGVFKYSKPCQPNYLENIKMAVRKACLLLESSN